MKIFVVLPSVNGVHTDCNSLASIFLDEECAFEFAETETETSDEFQFEVYERQVEMEEFFKKEITHRIDIALSLLNRATTAEMKCEELENKIATLKKKNEKLNQDATVRWLRDG